MLTLQPTELLAFLADHPDAVLLDVREPWERALASIALEGARIETRSTHGTGCTLASAIAAGVARGGTLEDAVRRAHRYVREAIARAPGFGEGHGPLDHAWTVREDALEPDLAERQS